MSLIYSSALEITSIMTCGRNCASIFDSVSSLEEAPPRINAVVITCLRLQASPMIAAARHHHHEISGVHLVNEILGAAGEIVEPAVHREALALLRRPGKRRGG